MLRIFAAIIVTIVSASTAFASCVGSSTFSSCWDNEGNNYSVQRYGNSTHVYGNNSRTGSSWSQDSYDFGNTTINNGRDSRGNSWSTTCTDYGCY